MPETVLGPQDTKISEAQYRASLKPKAWTVLDEFTGIQNPVLYFF